MTHHTGQVEEGDAGSWMVSADNGLGKVLHSAFTRLYRCTEQVVRRQISLSVYPSTVGITVEIPGPPTTVWDSGDTIVLQCTVQGYPPPQVEDNTQCTVQRSPGGLAEEQWRAAHLQQVSRGSRPAQPHHQQGLAHRSVTHILHAVLDLLQTGECTHAGRPTVPTPGGRRWR